MCLSALSVWAGSFSVSDPMQWNSTTQGIIEEIHTSINLKGAYARYDVELVLSCKDHTSPDTAQLESVIYFSLPEDASVIDASLLIEGVWTPGDLMERGLATSTYESVVKRRRDPLLFIRDNKTDYTMKIYPMLKKDARSMRFSYLLPVTAAGNVSKISVDTQFKLYSREQPKVNVLTFTGDGVTALRNSSGIVIAANNSVFSCDLSAVATSSVVFEAVNSAPQEIVLATTQYGKEKYFSLSISPEILYKNKLLSNKYIFVFDRDPVARNYSYYEYSTEQVYYESYYGKYWYYPYLLKDSAMSNNVFRSASIQLALNTVKDADSVMFIYPDASGNIVQTDYMLGTDANITGSVGSIDIATGDYTTLFTKLFATINNLRSANANLVVVSNNTLYVSDNKTGIALAQKVDSLAGKDNRMTIVSLESPNGYSGQSNNGFYNTLASLNKSPILKCGSVGELAGSSLSDLILERQNDNVRSISVNINAVNGTIYNRHDNIDRAIGKNKPCLLSGKFNKADSFIIDIVIESADSIYIEQYQLPFTAIGNDTLVRTAWACQQLNDVEDELLVEKQQMSANYYYYYYGEIDYSSYPRYLALRQEIISLSIAQRILSTETAFLSLEPSMVVEGCKDCANAPQYVDRNDNGWMGAVGTESTGKEVSIAASPNPFINIVSISIPAELLGARTCIIEILSADGHIVRTVQCSVGEYIWDGTGNNGAEVPDGIYTVAIRTQKQVYRLQLIKQ